MGGVVQRLGRINSSPRRNSDGAVPVPKGLNWLIWRVVTERVATLQEVETYYDLADLLDAHIALDLIAEAEERAASLSGIKRK